MFNRPSCLRSRDIFKWLNQIESGIHIMISFASLSWKVSIEIENFHDIFITKGPYLLITQTGHVVKMVKPVSVVTRVWGLRSNGLFVEDDAVLGDSTWKVLRSSDVMENAVREPNCLKSFSLLILWKENFWMETTSFGGNLLKSTFLDLYVLTLWISLESNNFFGSIML